MAKLGNQDYKDLYIIAGAIIAAIDETITENKMGKYRWADVFSDTQMFKIQAAVEETLKKELKFEK
jgi:hypothetical protein